MAARSGLSGISSQGAPPMRLRKVLGPLPLKHHPKRPPLLPQSKQHNPGDEIRNYVFHLQQGALLR